MRPDAHHLRAELHLVPRTVSRTRQATRPRRLVPAPHAGVFRSQGRYRAICMYPRTTVRGEPPAGEVRTRSGTLADTDKGPLGGRAARLSTGCDTRAGRASSDYRVSPNVSPTRPRMPENASRAVMHRFGEGADTQDCWDSASSAESVDNSHQTDLNPARLPIPPRPQRSREAGDQGVYGRVPTSAPTCH
jgi:hypothetical protein